jgi:hypothetical protein
MINEVSLLVTLVKLLDRLPLPATPLKRGRGRPKTYPDQLFLKALVVMIVKHLHSVNELRTVLDQPTGEMMRLRQEFTLDGKYPTRRTWQRRLKGLPDSLPLQIALLGRYLLEVLNPWQECGPAAAIDSTVLRAKGGVWHKKDREAGVVPHSSIDTEAHWTKSGWHGWVYGWKLHLIATVGSVWIPLAAELTSANEADNERALALLDHLGVQVRYLLGDTHYNDPEVRLKCEEAGRVLIAPRRGTKKRSDEGVEVRKIFHQLRSHSIENFNEQFKGIFDGHGSVPTKGLVRTRLWALGCVLVYQLALLYRYESGQELRLGLKSFLKAA